MACGNEPKPEVNQSTATADQKSQQITKIEKQPEIISAEALSNNTNQEETTPENTPNNPSTIENGNTASAVVDKVKVEADGAIKIDTDFKQPTATVGNAKPKTTTPKPTSTTSSNNGSTLVISDTKPKVEVQTPSVPTTTPTETKTDFPEIKIEQPTVQTQAPKPETPKPSLSHAGFNELLSKHVSSSGKVNYAGFKNDVKKLDAYLALLSQFPVQDSWSRSKKMAYWINAYNANTIKLILNNYPVASIMDLHGGKPWDQKWIKLGSDTYSLNNIENDILRPQFKDARIHFAVNCAAKSCPPLLNKAWTASNLESNFEKQAKAFVNNSKYNEISKGKVKISKIFEWYAEDFGSSITTYLSKYANQKIDSDAKVEYLEYDWGLNN